MRLFAPLRDSLFARLFRRSLLGRIVFSFFLLSSLIVMFLTVFSFWSFTRSARRQLVDQIGAIATIKAETLNRWVDEQTRQAMSIASFTEVRGDAAILCDAGARPDARMRAHQRLQAFFAALLLNYPEVHAVSLLSGEGGRIVFSTDAASEGQYRVLDSEFTEGMKRTSIQTVHPSPITLEPTMSVSTPVLGMDRATIGVLVVSLNLDSMDRIIQDRTGLGRTGEAYLVDRYNSFVSGARFGRANYPRGVHSDGIDAALKGRNGSGSYLNYAGIPVIAAYRWIAERDLALLVEVHQEEALRSAWLQTLLLVVIGFSLVLLLAFGVYHLARRIADPVLAIQQAALQVSAGDLDATAPVLTPDEVGDLAGSFNRMTVTVRGLYEELRRKEEHFRSLIESSMDIVVVLGADSSFSFASPSVERVLGFRPEELRTLSALSLVHPEDLEKCRGEYARLTSGAGDSVVLGFPVRIARKAGGWRTLEANARNLLAHPAISGFVINARDITERQQLEDKLLQAQKMEAVGRLAGGVAHDFNNLLTVVIGYADVLGTSTELNREAREGVEEISKAAKRAAELTQQLLAYSRKQVLQPRTIDLNSLLAGMHGMLRRLIGEDVEILTHAAADSKSVRADPSQIAQVIMNLAANARDAMPNGGAIVFETQNVILDESYCRRFPEISPGEYMMLAVSDTGCGMDEETKKRIFEPFFTTKGIGKGTGLGLATVYGIVKQSGGHIAVASELGRGSTFKIYLPVAAAERVAGRGGTADSEIPKGVESVLVVEDETPLRRMICMVLERAGYVVHAAASSEDVFPKAADLARIDLLVTDVILPGMNGKEIAEMLLPRHSSMQILYISGYTESAIGQHGNLPEETAFLQKPFSPGELARKVREVLDGR